MRSTRGSFCWSRLANSHNESQYTVHEKNLEWTHGQGGGGSLSCQPHSDEFEDEPLLIGDMVIELIAKSEQKEGVEIIRNDKMGSSASE